MTFLTKQFMNITDNLFASDIYGPHKVRWPTAKFEHML